jgi:long-chain fatty acid transport protein
MPCSKLIRCGFALAVVAILSGHDAAQAQFGVALSGAGPVNRSMGGASTAAPLDASGAMYWNPAAITGLASSELGFGVEVLYPETKLSSSLPANSFGPGFPPVGLAGTTRSNNGVFLLPTVGIAYLPEDSCFAYGLGLFSAGGFAVNYPGSSFGPGANPILLPPALKGLGPVDAELQVFQLVPTVAYQLTDRLSVGIAPTLSFAHLTTDPAFLDPNPDGSYPSATNGRLEAGGGIQAGIYYFTENCWHFGASLKSPQWFETFRYNSTDDLGQPRTVSFRFDYPMMASLGAAYSGFDRWVLATDFRYIDYRNTQGFEASGFDPSRPGAVLGLGWKSVFAVALGAQYEITPCCSVRFGYTYNTDPISNGNTIFNVSSPTILEHTVYVGASWNLTERFVVSVAYAHAFENSVQGQILVPTPTIPSQTIAIPGSTVQSNVSADTVMLGATVKF